jgi:hypothetical protein
MRIHQRFFTNKLIEPTKIKGDFMILIITIFTFIALGFFSLQAVAEETTGNDSESSFKPNGNYSSLSIGAIGTTYTTPVCYGRNCYKSLAGAQVAGYYQFDSAPNLVIGLGANAESASGTTATVTSGVGQFGVGLIGGFGPVDAGISYSSLSSTFSACANGSNVCTSISDTGSDFGIMGKLWLGDEKSFNIGLSLDSYSYSTSPTVYTSTGISATWLPAKHHSLSISSSSTVNQNNISISTGSALSYAYLF